MRQLTNNILMVRPANFGFNEQTAANNAFQSTDDFDSKKLKEVAIKEFDQMVEVLRSKGVNVMVVEDTPFPVKSDAVFPNNWISFHANGALITYPMFAPNRRTERREDIIEMIGDKFAIKNRYSFEFYEDEGEEGVFLESTGSMIFDRANSVVYACLSKRTDASLIDKFNILMDTQGCVFRAVDRNGLEIYHTNVMMALGEDFVVICMESIQEEESRKKLYKIFEETNKKVIEISYNQMESFAGNMLEVLGDQGKRYLVMSQTAYDSLKSLQKDSLEKLTTILPIDIRNIEKFGGGSVRCMMAEIFLPKK